MPSPLTEITSWHFRSQIALQDPAERLAALEALRTRKDPDLLIQKGALLLEDETEEVRLAAADALISVGGKNVGEEAGKALEHPEPGPRAAAVAVLAGIGRSGVGPALERLEHASSTARAAAVRALHEIGARTALDAVAALLGDPDPEVVMEAVRAVGALEGTEYIADLVVTYRRVPEARLAVLETLTRLDAHQSLDLFETVLQGADPELQRAALAGLQAADSPRAARILRSLADDESADTGDRSEANHAPNTNPASNGERRNFSSK